MSALYLIAAFVTGWAACWKVAEWLARKALRSPGLFVKALTRIDYDRLLRLRDQVAAEVEKRRAPLAGVPGEDRA